MNAADSDHLLLGAAETGLEWCNSRPVKIALHDRTGSRAGGDSITILQARGRRLAKLVRADGAIEDYDSARHFRLATLPVAGLNELERVLRRLMDRPDCCIVRGAIADPRRTHGVRRLLHPDLATGDVPTLQEAPRGWLGLDIDQNTRPAGVAANDLPGCAAFAIDGLPVQFHGARCIAQATASHGIKPGVRLRLWFWLDRPATGTELKRWLRAAPVDRAVFGAAQIVYTSAPVFATGVSDPLPERMIVIAGGRAEVPMPSALPLAPPERKTAAPTLTVKAAGAGRYAAAALISGTARVARAREGARHQTLLAEAMGLARLVQRGLLSPRVVSRALGGAAEMAGLPATEAIAAISWALLHPQRAAPGAMR